MDLQTKKQPLVDITIIVAPDYQEPVRLLVEGEATFVDDDLTEPGKLVLVSTFASLSYFFQVVAMVNTLYPAAGLGIVAHMGNIDVEVEAS